MQRHGTFISQKQILHMFRCHPLEPPRRVCHVFVSTYVIGTVHGLPSLHTHVAHLVYQPTTYMRSTHISIYGWNICIYVCSIYHNDWLYLGSFTVPSFGLFTAWLFAPAYTSSSDVQ